MKTLMDQAREELEEGERKPDRPYLEALLSCGMTRADLAEKLGCDPTTVTRRLNDGQRPQEWRRTREVFLRCMPGLVASRRREAYNRIAELNGELGGLDKICQEPVALPV